MKTDTCFPDTAEELRLLQEAVKRGDIDLTPEGQEWMVAKIRQFGDAYYAPSSKVRQAGDWLHYASRPDKVEVPK